MLESKIRDIYLVDELQLGNRLNKSLQDHDRADFNLLLAMLSHDILDEACIDNNKISDNSDDENLRAKFELPAPQEKYAIEDDFERANALSETLHQEGQRAVFLMQCLKQEPLVPVKHDLQPEVYNQFTPLKQEKIRRYFDGQPVNYENNFKESKDNFLILDEIKESVNQIA